MSFFDGIEDGVARFIGVTRDDRQKVIETMLGRSTSDVVGYWLQLVLSMGIATLGLALGSAAVVIGAMLISPLMSPLIELGAGLATGSLLLSFRAWIRTAGSIIAVVLGAAAMTRLLPFHEITSELSARTSPTMLDLFVAVFCALAAVYTTVRQSRDVMSAAAGTAIGISLVPPLCTAGYGLGISDLAVMRGGLLLFTANFAAIIAVATVCFLFLGFGQVPVGELEGELIANAEGRPVTLRAARLTRRIVGRRLGVLRFLLPAVLLAGIFVPLKRALEEVSWQVSVRSRVEDVLADVPGAVVRQSLEVRGGVVRVRIFLVGSAGDAQELAEHLRMRIALISGTTPVVEVIAVPDAATLDAVATQIKTAASAPLPSAPLPAPRPSLAATLAQVRAQHWPDAAGPLVRLRVGDSALGAEALDVQVTHLGSPLGAAGEQLLAQQWAKLFEGPVEIHDRALPAEVIEAPAEDAVRWLAELVRVLGAVDDVGEVRVCVTVPAAPVPPAPDRRRRAPAPPAEAPAVTTVRAVVETLAATRPAMAVTPGPSWRVEVALGACPPPP